MTAVSLLPIRFFRLFLEILNAELGRDTLSLVLAKGNLPPDLIDPQSASRFSSASAAETYARIQRTLRVYYGRGAHGSLVRIGRILWERLLDGASFAEKTQAQIIHSLPPRCDSNRPSSSWPTSCAKNRMGLPCTAWTRI